MNDDFLTRMHKPPRSEFADELYQRISEPMSEQRFRIEPFGLRRAAVSLGVITLLLAAVVMAYPPARAFAEAQFRQIGALIFRSPAADPAAAATVQPTVPAPGDTDRPEEASLLEDASRLSGFTVLAPGYLPAGYTVATVWSIDRNDSGIYVVSTYRQAASQQFLLLNQIRYAPGASFEQTIGDNEQLVDVTVRGQSGVWITGRLMTDPTDHTPVPPDERQLFPTNWLVWQEGDITYTLFGNDLSQEEMIKIAESVGR